MSSFGYEDIDSHEEAVRISGRVKWFDPGKGYGFIVPDEPDKTGLKDVLLHVTSLRQSGRENAPEGSTIVCDAIRRPKGWQVSSIVELDESSAAPMSNERPRGFDGGGFRRGRNDFGRRDQFGGDRSFRGGYRDRDHADGGFNERRGGYDGGARGRRPSAPTGPLERATVKWFNRTKG